MKDKGKRMPVINPIRSATVNAAATPEEVAFRLFSIIAGASENTIDSKDILPLFAKCMIAVGKPENILAEPQKYDVTLENTNVRKTSAEDAGSPDNASGSGKNE